MQKSRRQYDFEDRQRFCKVIARRSKLQFRPFVPGEEAKILSLCERVFGTALSEEEWRWRNINNPAGATFIHVAQDKVGRIIGHLAGVSNDYKIGNSSRKGFMGVNSAVDPSWRGRGIHAALTIEMSRRFCEEVGGLGFGFPNTQAYGPMLKLGLTRVLTVPMFVKILDWPKVIQSRVRSKFLASTLGGIAQLFQRRRRTRNRSDLHIEEVHRFGKELDALWHRIAPRLTISAVRDATHLNWRYFQRPGAPYRVFSASRNGDWKGYVVVRMLDKWGLRLGTLVDLIFDPDELDSGEILLETAELDLRNQGADAIWGLFSAPKTYERLLRRAGFFKTMQKRGARPFHFVIDFVVTKHLRPDLAARDDSILQQGDQWFLSLADTDLA